MLAQTSNSETAVVQPPANFFTSTLHARTLRATLQLLGWLLLHPAAWRAYSARVAPHLPNNFALSDLTVRHLRSAEMRRLLQIVYGFYPLLTMLVTALCLLLLKQPLVAIGVGTLCGTIVGWLGGLLVGATIGIPAGLGGVVAGVVAGVGAGTGGLFPFSDVDALALGTEGANPLPRGVTWGEMAGWIVLGMIASVAATTAPLRNGAAAGDVAPRHFWSRLASMIVGGAVGAFAIALLLLAERNGALLAWLLRYVGDPWRDFAGAGALGVLLVLVVWAHTGQPLRSWVWGASLAAVLGALALLLARFTEVALLWGRLPAASESALWSFMGGLWGVRLALLAGFSLSLLYVVGRRLGGEWGGAVSSALGSSGTFALLSHGTFARGVAPSLTFSFGSGGSSPWPILALAIVCACIGLSYPLWLPILLYPVEALWNAFLYQIDKRRNATSRPFLPAHSAYWDEHQRLPLPGLADYLVLAVERNPWGGYHALSRTWDTHQFRAVQQAQLELDARWMSGCGDVEAILRTANGVDPARLPASVRATVERLQDITQELDQALDEPGFYPKRAQLHAVEQQLHALLHEMVHEHNRYVSRLRPVVSHWRRLVWEHDQALAASIEMRKSIDSPYVVGVPLSPKHELFVGRTGFAAELATALESQTTLLLHGARLSGKTSLLNNLGRLLPGEIVPLVIDLQGVVTQSEGLADFLYALARTMINSARRHRGQTLPPLGREELADAPLAAFDEWLDSVEIELGDLVALLALDPYEVLDDAVAMGRLDADATIGTLWRAVQERPQFRLLLAGTHSVSQMEHWPRFVNHAQTLILGPLSRREALPLIEHPVPEFALRYEPDAVAHVVYLTGGHPALTQLLCHVIVALKNEGLPTRRGLATRQDVDHAVPICLKLGEFFFGELTRTLGERGVEIARMLALRGTNANITHRELAKHFAFYLDETLQNLQRSGIIEPLPENELAYRFQIELIRRWFVEWRKRENEQAQ